MIDFFISNVFCLKLSLTTNTGGQSEHNVKIFVSQPAESVNAQNKHFLNKKKNQFYNLAAIIRPRNI